MDTSPDEEDEFEEEDEFDEEDEFEDVAGVACGDAAAVDVPVDFVLVLEWCLRWPEAEHFAASATVAEAARAAMASAI
jgi:hypothetical protein